MKRQVISWALVLAVFSLFLGCTPKVTVKQEFTDEQRAGAQRLVEKWDEFDIYLYMWTYQAPAALVFDIKNDDKTLRVGRNWEKITTKESLLDVFRKGKVWREYAIPNVSAIIGPDGKDWGYAITIIGTVKATVADERTIDVQPPKEPPRPAR